MKVMVGLSGGVDSAVAAHLLLEKGFEVEALFMKNWDEDDGTAYCTAQEDLSEAERVADHLGIVLHKANFAAEYWDNVFEYFLSEYKACRTPNPDILCNKEIKFKVFVDYATALGADRIATGHYARLIDPTPKAALTPLWGQPLPGKTLAMGIDANKDQSYFLHALTTEQLERSFFPLGDLQKTAVRTLAKSLGLPNFARKDSTGICFIGERRFSEFLARFCPKEPGPIMSLTGQILGEHQGLAYYTIGQRQGLGIGGHKDHGDAPWFVAEKRLADNALVVVQGSEHPALYAGGLVAQAPHWIHPLALKPGQSLACEAKIRYRQQAQRCTITLDNNPEHQTIHVRFDSAQRAITPGQFIVFYFGDLCLGGAKIAHQVPKHSVEINHKAMTPCA